MRGTSKGEAVNPAATIKGPCVNSRVAGDCGAGGCGAGGVGAGGVGETVAGGGGEAVLLCPLHAKKLPMLTTAAATHKPLRCMQSV